MDRTTGGIHPPVAVRWGRGLTQENRGRNVGGSACVSPPRASTVLLILPAETREHPVCVHRAGRPELSGHAGAQTCYTHYTDACCLITQFLKPSVGLAPN